MHRLGVVWHSASNTFWFDANGDGKFAASERHALGDKPLEIKIAIPFEKGTNSVRTLMIRKRGDGIAWAIRGYATGSVTICGKKMTALLTDGNGDGCFDGAGADRIWLDLDGDGKLDPLTEQFPLGTAVTVDGRSILLRPRADGLGVQVRERPNEVGQLSVEIPHESGSKVTEINASYVSEFGELVVIKSADRSASVPAGKYRVEAIEFGLSDENGKVWHYLFLPTSHRYDIEVRQGKGTAHKALKGLKAMVSTGAVDARPGDSVQIQPEVVAGNLFLSNCTITEKFAAYWRGPTATIDLMETGSVLVDQCESGFA
jgi:hypothetical protein